MNIDWNDSGDYLVGATSTIFLPKIASFDLDDTLIKRPKRGTDEWSLWNDNVPKVIKDLVKKDFTIIIFTNQGGMSMNKNFDIDAWKSNFEKSMKIIFKGIKKYNLFVYVAKKYDQYRKPNLGLWDCVMQYYDPNERKKIIKNSFFCGDAAGRENDFSDTDRKFALNIGIQFYTPEEIFVHNFQEQSEKFQLSGFNPVEFIKKHSHDHFDYTFKSRKKEMIIMVGYPGSGKSEFVKKYILPEGYIHVNQDICKTKAKCINLAKKAMEEEKSLVIDNTNLDEATRTTFISIALQNGYTKIRCIHLVMDLILAGHLNNVRNVYSDGEISKVSDIAYKMMIKKYIPPNKEEKFDKIETINTNYFDFDKLCDPKWKKIFMQWSS